MKISYGITVKDELVELDRLLNILYLYKRPVDEIVIIFDNKNGSEAVGDYLRARTVSESPFLWHSFSFEGHFAELKNFLTKQCSGDYIFQLDADEYPTRHLLLHLSNLLEDNPQVDVFLVPRVNTVTDLIQQHIDKWGWRVDEKGWVNYPDYQWRIYKNTSDIVWVNKVHERLSGFKTFAPLPAEEEWSLYHPKDIVRQERQNALYDTL
jgi:cellulose synthase/poly-beta-1,6-N-acetylglucosamine synthase-like glycosyltransferase